MCKNQLFSKIFLNMLKGMQINIIVANLFMLKGRDQWEWIGLWKVAINRHLVRFVVIDVHFNFNLVAILE